MLNERPYKTAPEACAFLDGLTEVFDESILPIGMRQTSASPAEFVAAFVDTGRDAYSDEMRQIFSEEELERDDISGEEVVNRYLERFTSTEEFQSD